ncbi:MAG: M23 family metallopeptidase [Phototrophicaceae bacterium]
MQRFILIALILLLTVSASAQDAEITPEATESIAVRSNAEPIYSIEGDSVILDVYFNTIRQGRVGVLRLSGDNIERASAVVSLSTVGFSQLEGREDWWAFISIDMGQTIRLYDLIVTIEQSNADVQVLQTQFNVVSGGFISQAVQLAPDDALNRLLDPEIEAAELARIFEIASVVSDDAYWTENSFIAPSPNAELTSPFGAARVFNEELQTVHTGWDFNAPTGTPLMATASGQVAFAGMLDIRGNYVLVNHGRGIYSGYAHLAVVYVTQGQEISEGQVLGIVGSTGRSSSAHAHFEMIANGMWIDSADFLRMFMP